MKATMHSNVPCKNILFDIQKIIGIEQTKQTAQNNPAEYRKLFRTLNNAAAILTCLENDER